MKQLRWYGRKNLLHNQILRQVSCKSNMLGAGGGQQDRLWAAWAWVTMLVWAVCPQSRLLKNLTGKFNEWANSVISGDLCQPLIVSNVLSLRWKAFNSVVFQVPYKDRVLKCQVVFFFFLIQCVCLNLRAVLLYCLFYLVWSLKSI